MAYKTKKFYRTYQQLKDWYGIDRAEQESVTYCPMTTAISDTALKVLSTIASQDVINLMRLKENWENIAGVQIAKVATPRNIADGKAYIQVNHSIWLRELNGHTKTQLLKNIRQVLGNDFCIDLIFVP
jgi:predicted nucleic acid-binding Zn ribbon protein